MSSSRKRAPSPSASSKPSKQAKPVHSFFTPASQKVKASSGQSFWVKDAPLTSPSVLHYSHLAHLVARTPVAASSIELVDAPPTASGSSSTPAATSPRPTSSSSAAAPPPITVADPARVKVAFFDLDGTLIRTKSGAKFPKGADDWVFWSAGVCARVRQLHEDGWRIAIISNQNGLPVAKSGAQVKRDQWKAKIEQIVLKFPATPLEVLAALDKDHFRKPLLGLWDMYGARVLAGADGGSAWSDPAAVVAAGGDVELLDLAQSFYVGDAAGRKSDHGDGDRKWAANAGVRFFTPEMFFDGKPDDLPPLVGFQPSQLADEPFFTPTNTPLFPSPSPSAALELLLLVGPPGAGKSLFTREHLTPRGYVRVNQDELGSRAKCVARAREALAPAEGRGGGGRGPRASVVVDNTNRDRATRAVWIALAKELGVGVRIFIFNPTPALLALAKHNNLFRLYPSTPGAHVPPIATGSFVKAFEAVDGAMELGEGGEGRVKNVWMGGWRGGDEGERKRWEGWMS